MRSPPVLSSPPVVRSPPVVSSPPGNSGTAAARESTEHTVRGPEVRETVSTCLARWTVMQTVKEHFLLVFHFPFVYIALRRDR